MTDRTLAWWVRLPLFLMAAMQAAFGLTLLVNPAAVATSWPWPLLPITARLLGASSLVSVPLALLSALANRYRIARIPLVMMLTYRVVQLAAGLMHIGRFDFQKPATWNYFGAGGLMMVVLALALFLGPRLGRPADEGPAWAGGAAPLALGGAARWAFWLAGGVYLLLGAAFFALGNGAEGLWFEASGRLTPLTARLFASPALGLGLAFWLVPRARQWREVVVPAVGMATFGLGGGVAMLLELPALQPPSPAGYLVPLTPVVLLLLGGYLLLRGRGRA
jgi:hypothetical protein